MSIMGLESAAVNVLKSFSSENYPLTESEIAAYIESKNGIKADRRTLRKVLEILKNNNTCIKSRTGNERNGTRVVWYMENRYSAEEIKALTESLFFNPYLNETERCELLGKLAQDIGISELHKGIVSAGGKMSGERCELLGIINRAIKEHNMLIFSLKLIGDKGAIKLERDGSGRVKEYLVRPASVVICGGQYYLLAALGDREIMSYFPFERMYGLTLSGIFYRFAPLCGEAERKAVYPANDAESLRPCGGIREKITVRAEECAVRQLFSAFPDAFELRCFGGKSEIAFECNRDSAKYFLLQFGSCIEVLSPRSLRREFYEEIGAMLERYRLSGNKLNGPDKRNAVARKLYGVPRHNGAQ